MLMNLFGAVIFWTLIITFVVKLVSELLNLKAADAKLPLEFVGLFDEEAYRKSRDYLSTSTRFSLFSSAVDLSVLLFFWFTGGFNLLDQLLRGYGFAPIVSGVLNPVNSHRLDDFIQFCVRFLTRIFALSPRSVGYPFLKLCHRS